MFTNLSAHTRAVLGALLVTFLWSASYVLIKFGLRGNIPPLVFAGLRYTVASLTLLPFVLLRPEVRTQISTLPRSSVIPVLLLGVVYYFLTQGSQFVALQFIPAATLTLMLNGTPVLVAVTAYFFLNEKPAALQRIGIGVTLAGLAIYFIPGGVSGVNSTPGMIAATVQLFANAGSALLGRKVNHSLGLAPLTVTFISMSIGAVLLLVLGITLQGWPEITITGYAIILWMAVVHTAFAFTLWNKSLQVLTAVESVIINNTMLPQIVILAWVFLGETVSPVQIMGLCVVVLGAYLVQRKK